MVPRSHQDKIAGIMREVSPATLQRQSSVAVGVWPGGGKSVLPVIATHFLKKNGLIDSVVVVVPRTSLRKQGARAFLDPDWRAHLGHKLEIREAVNEENPGRNLDGYITTYSAIETNPQTHLDWFRSRRCLLCLDEVHHVAIDSATHRALQPLRSLATFSLFMTGTADKSDGSRISFLDYASPRGDGRLEPEMHVVYGLKDSLREKAIIHSEFKHIDGRVEYLNSLGATVRIDSLTSEDADDREKIHAALGTDYARQLLHECVQHWRRHRLLNPRSLLLVVCASIFQAKQAQKWLQADGVPSCIATSEDSKAAHEAIDNFRDNGKPEAIVTVAMAYEGMDVPAITHVACLTHIRSFPWLMQMFGRATRFDRVAAAAGIPWEKQTAYFYVPDDPLMQQAIDYVRREERLGVDGMSQLFPPDDDDRGTPVPAAVDAPASHVVPLSGHVTRVRASGIEDGQDIGYDATRNLESVIEKHGLNCSVTALASALADMGVNVHDLAAPQPPPSAAQPAALTAGEMEAKLRSSIQRLCNRLDGFQGLEHGTWNTRCFTGPQRCQKRDTLTVNQLKAVWSWLCSQAGKTGYAGEETEL